MKALAKKSTTNQRKEHNVEKYSVCYNLQLCRYLYSFICCCPQICEIPRNSL